MDKRRDIEHAAQEIEELFSDLWQVFPFARGARGYRPQLDVFRSDDRATLTILVELPGIDPDRVNVIASARELVVAGERTRPKDCGHYEQMEIEYGRFQRHVAFAQDVDPERATATYDRGILRIVLPLAPTPSRRENVPIEVRTRR